MIGRGNIPEPNLIRDASFMTIEEYELLPKREFMWPTGKQIGRKWLHKMYGRYMLCQWVDIKGITWLDVSLPCIIEWKD